MFKAGDTAIEFSQLDPRLLRGERASAETGRSLLCQLTKRDENFCGEQFWSKKVLRAHQLWSFSLAWVFGRTNACGVGHCCMHEAYEMGHCRVDVETRRWPHVMKGDAFRCPLCELTGPDWEDHRKHAISCHLLQPAPAPLLQRRSGVNCVYQVCRQYPQT